VSRYALLGVRSGELLSYGGRVLVHDSRPELEFLFPNRAKTRIVRITDGDLGQPTMLIRDHPAMVSVRWPLRREDFVHAG
jgi:hypothetical protein